MTPSRLIALIVGVLSPRFLILILWLFTRWFTGTVLGLWQVLGFIFAPYTLLWFTAVIHWFNGTWGPIQIVVLLVAIVFDFTPAKTLLKR